MTISSGKSDKKTTRLNGSAWRRAVQLRAEGASDEAICRELKCSKSALRARLHGDELLEALVLSEAEAESLHQRRLRRWRQALAQQIETMAFGKAFAPSAADGRAPKPGAARQDKAGLPRSVVLLADRIGLFGAAMKRAGVKAHQILAGLSAADRQDLDSLGDVEGFAEAA
jgi:hypothetical protein